MNQGEALKEFESYSSIREAAEKSKLTPRSWLERHLNEKYNGNIEEFSRDLDRALWGNADGYGEFNLPRYDPLDSLSPPDHKKLKSILVGPMAKELKKARDLEAAAKAKHPEGLGSLAFEYEKYLKQVSEGKPEVLNHLKQRRELAGPVIKMLCNSAGVNGKQGEALTNFLASFVSREGAPFKVSHWEGFTETREPFTREETEKLKGDLGGDEKAAEALKKIKNSIGEFSRTISENASGKGASVEEVHNTQHLTHILAKAIEHLKSGAGPMR